MPSISGSLLPPPDPYLPNIMLDVPGGVFVQNAPAGAGTEAYASNVQTRFTVDWDAVTQHVGSTRVQAVAKNSQSTGAAKLKVRDLTNGQDVAFAEVTGTATALSSGAWTAFKQPAQGDVTYAVFVEGDGIMDPTVYSVVWEWRGQ